MGHYHNLFLKNCQAYAKYRRSYPVELFDRIFAFGDHETKVAVDVGTGNGQAAHVLAGTFEKVFGVDVSSSQISQAPQLSNVSFHVGTAENFLHVCCMERHSVDLVTVAQALHWFNHDDFYSECRRALKPNGTLAAWCYPMWSYTNNSKADEILKDFCWNVLGPYWAGPTKHCQNGYIDLNPGKEHFSVVERVIINAKVKLNMKQCCGNISTWSAYTQYKLKNSDDPLISFRSKTSEALNLETEDEEFEIDWPIYLLLAKHPMTSSES